MGLLKELGGKKVYLDSNIFIYTVEEVIPWARRTVEVLRAIDQRELYEGNSVLRGQQPRIDELPDIPERAEELVVSQ